MQTSWHQVFLLIVNLKMLCQYYETECDLNSNEYAKRLLNLIKTNVVGETGFNTQVRGRNPDGGLDATGNRIIEEAFLL